MCVSYMVCMPDKVSFGMCIVYGVERKKSGKVFIVIKSIMGNGERE